MSPQVTETDLRRFAEVGYPASVRPARNTDVQRLAESAVHALEAPSARLAKALKFVLEHLAKSDELDVFHNCDLSDDARRRLGYLAARCARERELSSAVQQRLSAFADRLHRGDDSKKPHVTFMTKTNPTLLRLQAQRADNLNKQWNVFGD